MPTAKPKSDEKPDAEAVAGEKPDAPDEDEPTFTVERLIAEAEGFFGGKYVSADVAGAYDGVAPSKEVTVKDARSRVAEWLKADVRTED